MTLNRPARGRALLPAIVLLFVLPGTSRAQDTTMYRIAFPNAAE